MRHSLTRVRYSDSDWEHPKNNLCSKDSLMCADNDAHSAECYSNSLKVGIADEVAYPKNVSWFRVDGYGRSDYHSNRLGELSKSSSGRKSKYPELGKR